MYIAFPAAFAIAALVTACRKDPTPQDNDGVAYNPTYLDPTKIFPSIFGIPALPADNPLTEEAVYLGRMLFYDPVLSLDSSISCSSCHDQKHAFADPRKVSTGVFGLQTGRNAPPLFNMAYNRKFFWDGRQNTLRELVFEPIQAHNEMAMTLPILKNKLKNIERYKIWFKKAFNAEPDVFNMAKAMEQFMLTIVSSNSRFNAFFPGRFSKLTQEEGDGARLFNALVAFDVNNKALGADCFHCHGGQLAQQNNPTMGGFANNGLDLVLTDRGLGAISGKSTDDGVFKTPSLLNIAVTGPYMHDGRFTTLEQVIDHYSDNLHFKSPNLHPQISVHETDGHLNLDATQKAALKAFLMTMTDSVLLNNPAYSNPFK